MEEGHPNLRSKESIRNAFVEFSNKTQRIVDVYWVDYKGALVSYTKLDPGARATINTFSTHPWIFKDFYTGERMHAENNDVYWPKPVFIGKSKPNNDPTVIRGRRENIAIHLPMRSLRQNTLWAIAKQLNSIGDVDRLEIPKILKEELYPIFQEYNKHRLKYINEQEGIQ